MNKKWLDLWIAGKHRLDMSSRTELEKYRREKLNMQKETAAFTADYMSSVISVTLKACHLQLLRI